MAHLLTEADPMAAAASRTAAPHLLEPGAPDTEIVTWITVPEAAAARHDGQRDGMMPAFDQHGTNAATNTAADFDTRTRTDSRQLNSNPALIILSEISDPLSYSRRTCSHCPGTMTRTTRTRGRTWVCTDCRRRSH